MFTDIINQIEMNIYTKDYYIINIFGKIENIDNYNNSIIFIGNTLNISFPLTDKLYSNPIKYSNTKSYFTLRDIIYILNQFYDSIISLDEYNLIKQYYKKINLNSSRSELLQYMNKYNFNKFILKDNTYFFILN